MLLLTSGLGAITVVPLQAWLGDALCSGRASGPRSTVRLPFATMTVRGGFAAVISRRRSLRHGHGPRFGPVSPRRQPNLPIPPGIIGFAERLTRGHRLKRVMSGEH